MLVLTRRIGESIIIGNGIKLTVVTVAPGRVRIGIDAPPSVRVDREEVYHRVQKEVAEEKAVDVLDAVTTGYAPADQATIVCGPDTGILNCDPAAAEEDPTASMPRLSSYLRKPR
jgi:carbon storage regulator